MKNVIGYEWVIAQYPAVSKVGQQALTEALAGAGGFLQNKERGKNDPIIIASRRPLNGRRPAHLVPATPAQVTRLEELFYKRHPYLKPKADLQVEKVVAMFPGAEQIAVQREGEWQPIHSDDKEKRQKRLALISEIRFYGISKREMAGLWQMTNEELLELVEIKKRAAT